MDKLPWVGVSVRRKEDERLLRGAGQFLDDLDEIAALHVAIGRCPYPHARIRGVDTRAALEMPGVEAVLLGEQVIARTEPTSVLRPFPGSSRTLYFAMAHPVARYEGEAARNRQAKEVNRRQWERLGVPLSRQVVEFHLPYCTHVQVMGGVEVNDGLLLEARDRLEALSRRLGLWHEVFRATYFADVSFLLASFAFGLHQAVATKFSVVRELVTTGERGRLARLMEEVPDVCAGLF